MKTLNTKNIKKLNDHKITVNGETVEPEFVVKWTQSQWMPKTSYIKTSGGIKKDNPQEIMEEEEYYGRSSTFNVAKNNKTTMEDVLKRWPQFAEENTFVNGRPKC